MGSHTSVTEAYLIRLENWFDSDEIQRIQVSYFITDYTTLY